VRERDLHRAAGKGAEVDAPRTSAGRAARGRIHDAVEGGRPSTATAKRTPAASGFRFPRDGDGEEERATVGHAGAEAEGGGWWGDECPAEAAVPLGEDARLDGGVAHGRPGGLDRDGALVEERAHVGGEVGHADTGREVGGTAAGEEARPPEPREPRRAEPGRERQAAAAAPSVVASHVAAL
jgi:hypothetical protein